MPNYLSLSTINKFVPLARDLGVSAVARGSGGFLSAYRRAGGNPDRLSDQWAKKRDAFIARHMSQVKQRGESLWEDGLPSRRHLALIMWAYSPDASKLSKTTVREAEPDEVEDDGEAKKMHEMDESTHVVADFSTLPDLISHAASILGATHTSGSEANTIIYFPRGGQYPYEEATVWRKNGYWHAQGPGSRTGVESLPRDARPIGGARGGQRAAESKLQENDGFFVEVFGGESGRRDKWRYWDRASSFAEANSLGQNLHASRKFDGVRIIDRATGNVTRSWGAPQKSNRRMEDYIAVDRNDRTIAGPFKSYSDARGAAGTAGNVKFVPKGRRANEASRRRFVPGPNDESRERLAGYIAHLVMYDGSTSERDLVAAYHLSQEEARAALSDRGAWYGPGGRGYEAYVRHIRKVLAKKEWFSAPDPKLIPGAARGYGRYAWLLENAAPKNTDQGRKDASDIEDLQRQLTAVGFNGWGLAVDNWPEAQRYYDASPSVYRRHARSSEVSENGEQLSLPGDDESRGEAYADEQLASDYFRDWAWEQMVEGDEMRKNDPSSVIPLESRADFERLARRMLQDMEFDTRRSLRESAEFFTGFRAKLRDKATVDWFAEELELMQKQIGGTAAAEEPRGYVRENGEDDSGLERRPGNGPDFTNASVNRNHAMRMAKAGMSAAEIAKAFPAVFSANAEGQLGQKYDSIYVGSGRKETRYMITKSAVDDAIRAFKQGLPKKARRAPKALRSAKRKRR